MINFYQQHMLKKAINQVAAEGDVESLQSILNALQDLKDNPEMPGPMRDMYLSCISQIASA